MALEKQIEELTEKSKEENYIIKGKLSEKEKEIDLRHNDKVKEDALATLSDQVSTGIKEAEIGTSSPSEYNIRIIAIHV
jgi:hypothetical protein